jgi:Fe-S-cluster-containing hydrogenase component 2
MHKNFLVSHNNLNNGVLDQKRIKEIPGYPGDLAFEKGPIAIIECDQDIPCNPCEEVCPRNAIIVGQPITNLPKIYSDNCNGCTRCITICPGLCIFVINKNYSDTESLIYLPYEFYPIPDKNENVDLLNNYGEVICTGKIKKIIKPLRDNKTYVLGVVIPKKFFMVARAVKLKRKNK